MPRAKKAPGPANQGGYQPGAEPGGAQPPVAPTGMPYGAHQASISAQQAMPVAGPPPAAPPGAPPGAIPPGAPPPAQPPPPAGTAPVSGGNPFEAALQAALAARSPDSMSPLAQTQSVQPLPPTAGLAHGPGPGPEALGQRPPAMVEMLERVAQANGDPQLARLADLAKLLSTGRT